MAVPVERRMKRWQEQRWILDNVIRTVGIEWDQPRHDELSPIEHTYQLFDQIKTPKQLVVYQGERHAIGGPAGGLGPNWLTLIADWLRNRADQKPMSSEKVYVDVTGRQNVTLL